MKQCYHVNYGTHENPGVRCTEEAVEGKYFCTKHLKSDAGTKYKVGETVQHQVGHDR